MICPNDNTQLLLSERQGIEIDYCPQCRGVWLERGELDKLIEKANVQSLTQVQSRYPQSSSADNLHYGRHENDDSHNRGSSQKRKSMLGELFDF